MRPESLLPTHRHPTPAPSGTTLLDRLTSRRSDEHYDNAKASKASPRLPFAKRYILAIGIFVVFALVMFSSGRVDAPEQHESESFASGALSAEVGAPLSQLQSESQGQPILSNPPSSPKIVLPMPEEARPANDGWSYHQRQPFDFHEPDPVQPTAELESALWEKRQKAVAAAFRWSWMGYVDHAWGYDELLPISRTGSNWFHMGLTIIDALDTALIMGQTDVFEKAKSYVHSGLSFGRKDVDENANVFEITIRVLGGLLSTYHLSKDRLFLNKAVEVAEFLMPAFSTPSGIPFSSINLGTGNAEPAPGGLSSTAEATTLQMEFKYLSKLTGDSKYWNVSEKIMEVVRTLPKTDGLVPIYIRPESGQFEGSEIRLGSRGDSYYEYLGKQYLLTGEEIYRTEFNNAVAGIRKHLVGHSRSRNLTYIGELVYEQQSPKMDHLVCFLPATLAIFATGGRSVTAQSRTSLSKQQQDDLSLAEELTRSCFEMYNQTATGLAPEIVFWNPMPVLTNGENGMPVEAAAQTPSDEPDFFIHQLDGHNLLRPETIESLFTLYRITGDRQYREWGWRIFRAFERWCRVKTGGYTSLDDVRVIPPNPRGHGGKMETFFLGETLKYFYLLFDDHNRIPLDQYVFNTEAHPFPRF